MQFRRIINKEKFAGGRGATQGQVRSEKRASGRLNCSKVRTPLGQVRDLSATGCRINCKKKPALNVDQRINVELKTEEQTVHLPARVVWIRVQEDCSFDIGFEFENMDVLRKRDLIDVVRTGIDCDGLSLGWAPME